LINVTSFFPDAVRRRKDCYRVPEAAAADTAFGSPAAQPERGLSIAILLRECG
jgi:hypothetical protein